MTIEQVIEYYRQDQNKTLYFLTLPIDFQIELYKSLATKEREDLLAGISVQDIIEFTRHPDLDKNEVYSHITFDRLRELYDKLPVKEKEEFYQKQNDIAKNNLEEAQRKLNVNNENINNQLENKRSAKENIASSQKEITRLKEEVKNLKVSVKSITKEEKKALKKVLKAMKPSKLDRITIVSKMRAKKLAEKEEIYNQINERKMAEEAKLYIAENSIEIENANIRSNKNAIDRSYEDINKAKLDSNENVRIIRNTTVKIKALSMEQKRSLSKKHHEYKSINKIMVTKASALKKKLSAKKEEVASKVKEEIKNIDIKATLKIMMSLQQKLEDLGINMGKPVDGPTRAGMIPSNSIAASISPEQFQMLNSIIQNNLLPAYQDINSNDLENGKVRTLTKAGYINIGLLSIGLIILSLISIFVATVIIGQ